MFKPNKNLFESYKFYVWIKNKIYKQISKHILFN